MINKKVLILCTGNSCRSIIAEAVLNAYLDGVDAYSAGVKAHGKVNKNAKKLLTEARIWKETYHSKTIKEVEDIDFDLVVTVCDNAQERCPLFPNASKVLHISYQDPDGKNYATFEKLFKQIKMEMTPIIRLELGL